VGKLQKNPKREEPHLYPPPLEKGEDYLPQILLLPLGGGGLRRGWENIRALPKWLAITFNVSSLDDRPKRIQGG